MLAAAHPKSVRCKVHWRIARRVVGKREPDDVRASRPVLREPRGETPRGYSPISTAAVDAKELWVRKRVPGSDTVVRGIGACAAPLIGQLNLLAPVIHNVGRRMHDCTSAKALQTKCACRVKTLRGQTGEIRSCAGCISATKPATK
jgi:hypothetical protein